ncbi:phosphate acetyltransferase [Candidatus Neomarinimicrobiota bacterium]
MPNLIDSIRRKAAKLYKTIVLPESADERIVQAAARLSADGQARVILIGKPLAIQMLADDHRLDLSNTHIVDPDQDNRLIQIIAHAAEKKFAKQLSSAELTAYCSNPIHFGAGLVGIGEADAMVAGAATSTSEVVRTALRMIGVAPGSKVVSSSFMMVAPDGDTIFTYSDCAVIPDPDSDQLAAIAGDAHRLHQALTGHTPRVAFLSFSTKGSATHEKVDKVREAAEIFMRQYPEVAADGELQLDTAILPSIAALKAPDSPVKGQANVLIFPDLDAGNIGYKLTERIGGFHAIGPLLQGLARPVHDLSRGCSVEDIEAVVAIAALQTTL